MSSKSIGKNLTVRVNGVKVARVTDASVNIKNPKFKIGQKVRLAAFEIGKTGTITAFEWDQNNETFCYYLNSDYKIGYGESSLKEIEYETFDPSSWESSSR